MKQFLYILITFFFLLQKSTAQQPADAKIKLTTYHNQLAAGPAIPLAHFSETHLPGITTSYIRKMSRLNTRESFKRKKTGWLLAASLSHFMGRKEIIGNSAFRYKGYSLIGFQGGVAWYPVQKINFSFRTGPGLGYYNKIFRFTATGQFQCSYRISSKTNITPGLSFIKESGSDALWITSIQLGFFF